MKILYTTEATSSGGPERKTFTADGNLSVSLSMPKELGGPGGSGTNPEQLFAMGYSACFMSALKFVANKSKVVIPEDASVTAKVSMGMRDDGEGFGFGVELAIRIPGLERTSLDELVQKAEKVCPYAHATHGNIPVKLTIV